jgi:hypothetical protein
LSQENSQILLSGILFIEHRDGIGRGSQNYQETAPDNMQGEETILDPGAE